MNWMAISEIIQTTMLSILVVTYPLPKLIRQARLRTLRLNLSKRIGWQRPSLKRLHRKRHYRQQVGIANSQTPPIDRINSETKLLASLVANETKHRLWNIKRSAFDTTTSKDQLGISEDAIEVTYSENVSHEQE